MIRNEFSFRRRYYGLGPQINPLCVFDGKIDAAVAVRVVKLVMPVCPVKSNAGIGEITNPGYTVQVGIGIVEGIVVGHVAGGAFINDLIIAGWGGIILICINYSGGHGRSKDRLLIFISRDGLVF